MSRQSQTKTKSREVQPQPSKGVVPILGEKVQVGAGTVPSSSGTQPKIVTALRKAARKGVFPPAPVPVVVE